MGNKTILLNRLIGSKFQVIGQLSLLLDGYIEQFTCKTLEPQWNDNEVGNSCIKHGKYKLVVRWSKKYGRHLEVQDVYGRTLILIHWGNFRKNTKGCILTGHGFIYLDDDEYLDITSSRRTFNKLMSLIDDKDELNLVITPIMKMKL